MPVISAFGAFAGEIFVLREVVNRPVADRVAAAVPADDPERLLGLRRRPADVLQGHAESHAAPPSFAKATAVALCAMAVETDGEPFGNAS